MYKINIALFLLLPLISFSQEKKSTEQKYEEEKKRIDEAYKKESKTVARNWKQEQQQIFKKWGQEQKTISRLIEMEFGKEKGKGIFKTEVDYEKKDVRVTSIACAKTKQEAEEKAKALAMEKMYDKSFKLITPEKETLEKKEEKEIKEVVKNNTKTVKKEILKLKDGTYKVKIDIEQPITGKETLSNVIVKKSEQTTKKKGIKKLMISQLSSSIVAKAKKWLDNNVSTGLIVDTKGLDFKPCIAPRIATSDGMEVYGSLTVNREYAIEQGMVSWATNFKKAKSDKRIGKNPLTVKATMKKGRFTLVIDSLNAAKTLLADKSNDFLSKCKVIIVID